MTESHDSIQRLINADPVRTAPRDYPDADRVVHRALAAKSRSSIGVAFRAQVASAVLGASLLTGVGITALQSSAPSLPVLALSSPSSTTNASDSKMAGSMLRPMMLSDFRFDGSALTELPSSAPVWRVTGSQGLDEFKKIATALGLEGPVAVSTYEVTAGSDSPDTTYSITDPQRGTLSYSAWSGGSLGSWWFSADATSAQTSISNSQSVAGDAELKDQFTQRANDFATSLQLGYEFGKPDVYLYDNGDGAISGASVSFTMLLDGLETNIGLYVSFDGEGQVTSASGSLGQFERVGNYPLTGVADGVVRLQDQNSLNVTASRDATAPTNSVSSTEVTDGAVVDPVPSVEPAVVHVELTSVQVQLQMASVGGATYLVPYYVYGGTVNPGDSAGGSWDGTWSVIAVSSKYITIDQPRVMPMAAR